MQPGSLASEGVALACAFDVTGSRLVCGLADKTVQTWRRVDDDDKGAREGEQ